MSLLQTLKRAFEKINDGRSVFDVPPEKQKQFLESLPEPKDDIERSYLQYRCQNALMKRGVPLLLNCAAIPLLPLYSWKLRQQVSEAPEQQKDAVMLSADPIRLIPDSLREEFEIFQVKDFQSHLHLTKEDLTYLRMLRKRFPFAFYFRLKCMLKVAMYSHAFSRYAPRAVICTEEVSFTTSLLTDYCRKKGAEHIDVMHGEKLYFIRDAFFHFSRCYVWDQHYVDLLTELQAEQAQFRIELPPSMRFSCGERVSKTVNYTYYLANEPREQVETILENLAKLREKGAVVAIRLHPIYFEHSDFLYKDNRGFLIERPGELSIEDSLQRTGCAISLYSTVLQQAALNGIPFAIDDISDKGKYNKLAGLRFICLTKPHRLLSELITEKEAVHGGI